MATKRLVIVESATKARKIQPYLGSDYIVEASVGHIRDLPRGAADIPAAYKKQPWARLGVDVDHDFQPLYIVNPDKKKKVADLKAKLKQVDELYLATDPDREGEAIAWHLLEVLKPKIPVRRMVFHEITKQAILAAANNTRELDTNLVDAQETRRVLDRLYGYEISPVLWKKVMPRLSAGRVQSVATRVIVERERERIAFTAASYWDLTATIANPEAGASPATFDAKLVELGGRRIATGRDFTDAGELATTSVVALDEAHATRLAAGLAGAQLQVATVEEKPYSRKPAAPFMTSTLQQEAGRKLHFTSERTMRIAQRLYENGHITYMRTDSTTLSQAGLNAARSQARELFGDAYVADAPRQYTRKVKNSQEAHEAIRPAGETFATPDQLSSVLDSEEYRLYELIWRRTVASQMADARGNTTRITLAGHADTGEDVTFAASGRTITFPGFLKVYRDTPADTGDAAGSVTLPQLAAGTMVDTRDVTADGHTTTPPARYTEASLVKKMEELGIGRPSTYATVIKTIQDRGYVYARGNALVPSWVAFAVVGLLEQNFASLVDYDFTSSMEDELDAIAAGVEDRSHWLHGFYFGDHDASSAPGETVARLGGLKNLVGGSVETIDARAVNSIHVFDDADGNPIVVRVGRFGPYLERSLPGAEEPQRANLPEDVTPDELDLPLALELLTTPPTGRELGINPANGRVVVAKKGRFGPYVTELVREDEKSRVEAIANAQVDEEWAAEDAQRAAEGKRKLSRDTKTAQAKREKRINELVEQELKPATASLFSTMDVNTVTLEEALKLMSLPRVVGVDPTDGETIEALNGRYGPYLRKGNDSRSLASEEQIFEITLEQACEIYTQPKRRGRTAAAPPLKQLGTNDVSGKPMSVKEGRFGPYVTDGETNASLRKGDSPEAMTDERACELLSERRAKDAAAAAEAALAGTVSKVVKRSRKSAKKSVKKAVKKATKKTTRKASR